MCKPDTGSAKEVSAAARQWNMLTEIHATRSAAMAQTINDLVLKLSDAELANAKLEAISERANIPIELAEHELAICKTKFIDSEAELATLRLSLATRDAQKLAISERGDILVVDDNMRAVLIRSTKLLKYATQENKAYVVEVRDLKLHLRRAKLELDILREVADVEE